jgi:hypothetical protein
MQPAPPFPYIPSSNNIVFDSVRNKIVLVGSRATSDLLMQTWEYDQDGWASKSTAHAPLTRGGASIAFDPDRGKVVLFGGSHWDYSAHDYADTWEYDGLDWALQSPAHSPTARGDAPMVYDTLRQRMVLVGGVVVSQMSSYLEETWVYASGDWQHLPISDPSGRAVGRMAYDDARDRAVLWGGLVVNQGAQNDTWEFDGTSWSLVVPTWSPPASYNHRMTYDSVRQQVQMYGGSDDGRVYAFDGATWRALAASTPPEDRRAAGLAFDRTRNRLVVYAGSNGFAMHTETWELE